MIELELEVVKNLISIVDDDESLRRTTTFLIESLGFERQGSNLRKFSEISPAARDFMSHR